MSRQPIPSDGLWDSGRNVLDQAPMPQAHGAQATTIATVARHQRIVFLDVAKGIGILLVVLGHCLIGLHDAGMVAENSAAWLVKYVIYCFHMPLFFFLTGSLVHARVVSNPGRFLRGNLLRIAYPYFLWGAIQSLALLGASGLVNHPIREGIGPLLLSLLWRPPGQFWFLYTLFLLHMFTLVTIRLGGRVMLAIALAAIFAATAISPTVGTFIASYIQGSSLLAYAVGICFGEMVAGWHGRIESSQAWILASIILLFAAAWTGWRTQAGAYSYVTLPAACSGCVGTLLIARTKLLCSTRWLIYLGQRSMAIYVLHVLFVAGIRIIMVRSLHIAHLGIVLPAVVAAGIAGPLMVDRMAQALRVRPLLGLS